jgi:hypothetical protein
MKPLKAIAPLIPYLAIPVGLFWAQRAWVALLGFHAGMFAILWIERPAIPILKLFYKEDNLVMLAACAILGGSAGVLLYFLWPFLGNLQNLRTYLASIGLTSATWPFFLAYFCLVNPWLEECFWRGYLGSPSKSLTAMDLLFAGYHLLVLYGIISLGWLVLTAVVLTLTAWLWRQTARASGGLLIASLSHLAADLSVLLVAYSLSTKG